MFYADMPTEMWSIEYVIYELYTGKHLIQGRSNDKLLKLMMPNS
jgi:hypothetical protein